MHVDAVENLSQDSVNGQNGKSTSPLEGRVTEERLQRVFHQSFFKAN